MAKEVILIPQKITEDRLEKLKEVAGESEFILCEKKEEITKEILEKATILFGNLSVEQVSQMKNLKWMQTNSAGVDAYCKEGVLCQGAVLTNATGAYGTPISEYMVGCVFAFYKNLLKYKVRQPQGLWSNVGHVKYIENTKVLVLGLGDIGSNFALRMKQLGAYTIGLKRTIANKPDYIDELYTNEELKNVVKKADIIALSLPRTPQTYHIINQEILNLMKEDALIINVGRGEAIDTEALVNTLKSGKLLGAALDVFEQEPLDASHPLWQMDNVLITPHVSGGNYDKETGELVFNLMFNNFKRYFMGQPLENIVDITTGYKKSNS